ncbi:MAG: hypothetical protein ABI763_15725 [Bacteroidota bacterium]
MIIQLYQQTKEASFRLSQRTLLKLGFTLELTDESKGIISSQKKMSSGHTNFFDVLIKRQLHSIKVSLVSSVLSGNTGTFIADAVSEEQFMEIFHDLLRIQLPDNPLKLSYNDYALAVGF